MRIRQFQLLILLCLALAVSAPAHDLPNDITVRAFVKPAGSRLQLLVRAPLKVVRDLEFPEREKGYLDIEKLGPLLSDAATVWIAGFIELYEGDKRLVDPRVAATQISIDSDRSFQSFDTALSHVTAQKLSSSANVVWNQVFFDVLLEYPIASDQSEFSVYPRFDKLAANSVTALQFVPVSGPARVYEFQGDAGRIALDPRWYQAALRFVELGFSHILDGTDHLLFLLCLVIPFRQLRSLIVVVTAFTVAHSITLIASAYNLGPDTLWFPPLIETLIAASIVYMALENIVGATTIGRRWALAFGFGLVHGFGFSFILRETLQFAGSHVLSSLLWFNVGVELGQLLVLVLLIPALNALFKYVVPERMGSIILSALVAHTAWHWMTERWESFRQFPLPRPGFELLALVSWAAAILIGGMIAWAISRVLRERPNAEALKN